MSSKALLAAVSVVVALGAGVENSAAVRSSDAQGIWIQGKVHGFATAPPSPTNESPVPLYIIAPVSRLHPQHTLADARAEGYGAHDHVAAKVFSGPCDLTLLVPGTRAKGRVRTRRIETPLGPKRLVYAVQLGGQMRPLTYVGRIGWAEKARRVRTIDMHDVISCTVSP